jgi:phosphatidylserine/phosphatidylglycerophosphate/cardiolipin synthase-like enzyme
VPRTLEEVVVEIALSLPPRDCERIAAAMTAAGRDGLRHFAQITAGTLLRGAASELLEAWTIDRLPAEVAGLLRGASAGIARQRMEQAIDVVWTGPDSGLSTSRSTEVVVSELVGEAQVRLLLVSYNVTPYQELDTALRTAAARGVEILLLLERPADNDHFRAPRRDPFPGLPASRWAWPGNRRPPGASLHAKLIVVDHHTAFVSSANLSGRAATDNLECGLLVRGGNTARDIRNHLIDLYRAGHLLSVPSG